MDLNIFISDLYIITLQRHIMLCISKYYIICMHALQIMAYFIQYNNSIFFLMAYKTVRQFFYII
jgi:hypothetical protein